MRVGSLANPKSMSAESCERPEVDSSPKWLTLHFDADWLPQSERQPAPSKRGVMGQLEVCLTHDKRDVKLLQKLRYKVFYEQGQAVADIGTWLMRRDTDYFDGICDHLMAVARPRQDSSSNGSSIVGTYRLLRQDVAERNGGFYSAKEFDISGLLKRHAGLR